MIYIYIDVVTDIEEQDDDVDKRGDVKQLFRRTKKRFDSR